MGLDRNSAAYRARQQARRRSGRGGRRAAAGPDRGVVRLVICGGVFVALVAVKLLFPGALSSLARSAGELIGRDADFKEAFAAMGRAISGEAAVSDSLQDAYTAVFSPASGVPDTAPPEQQPEPASTGPDQPETRLLRQVTPRLPQADDGISQASALTATADPEPVIRREEVPVPDSPAGEPATPPDSSAPQPEEPEDDTTTAAASYVYTMPAVPENASLEQRNLGFDHVNPLLGRMTSGFEWREHPVSGGNKFHYGVDLAAEWGSDICAFADGEVYATGESSTLGKYVMLQHDGGYVTLYAHCSAVTTGGGRVSMGEKIAEVGDTGVATGPHLHFELHDGELYLNPIYYIEVE